MMVGACRSWAISRMSVIHFSTWANAWSDGSRRPDPGIDGVVLEFVSDMAELLPAKKTFFRQ